jgi:hypothetical protein
MLSAATLKNNLLNMFDPGSAGFLGWPATLNQGITNLANAYQAYAATAWDASNDLVATVNIAGFKAALAALVPGSTIAQAAQAFDNAFVAYWTGAVFAIGIVPTPASPCPSVGGTTLWSIEISSVVSVVTPNILKNLLLAEFAVLSADANAKATAIANAFHSATTTAVTVLITGLDTTPPPAGPLPITNTCTIF